MRTLMTRRVALMVAFSTGCAGAPKGPDAPPEEVERTERAIDLSGDWNDTDADLVARGIIEECLKSKWADTFKDAQGKNPVVRLYPIKNRTTDGQIDYRYFTKQIEAALVGSGKVDVVSSLEELEDDEGEVPDAPPEELAADFVLNGTIVSQDDFAGKQEVRAYLTSIELVEVATNKKAWVGQKRIRKLITR